MSQGPWGPPPWPQAPQQFPQPTAAGKRSPAPFILGALIVTAAAMIGFILYSLLSGPDYQNDDYVPPPPGTLAPLPDAQVSEVDTLLTANPLYAQTLPVPVRCDLTNPDLHLPSATDDEVKAYIDDLMACNMRVWDQPFQGTQRFQLVRPAVNIYHDSVTTPCGGGRAAGPNAIYCLVNQQVYFSRQLSSIPRLALVDQPHMIDVVMSHEFAHGIQGRTVILHAELYKSQQAPDEAAALELSRRVELQADCFAGMFVQSVRPSVDYSADEIARMQELVRAIGDDGDRPGDPSIIGNHGSAASREYWYRIGLSTTDVGACNTFSAPEHFVR